jgi:hypothetical protein
MNDTSYGPTRGGLRRLLVQLGFALVLITLVGAAAFVEWVPGLLVIPLVPTLIPVYFAVEDPDRREELVRMAAGLYASTLFCYLLF